MLLYRTILLAVGGGGLLVGIILVFVLAMSWVNSTRLQPASEHIGLYLELQQLREQMEEASDVDAVPGRSDQAGWLAALRRLAANPAWLSADTAQRLSRSADLLADRPDASRLIVPRVIGVVQSAEGKAHQSLLDELEGRSRREFHAALVLGVVLLVFAAGFIVFFQRRVLAPLNDLSGLLELLAHKDYAVIAIENVDPLIRPLFEKYNQMVKRMRDLERGHVKREDNLRDEVDQATLALFQQQVEMARVERLAAVGEVVARLSHELRNPLSGGLMTLTNLRTEIDSQDHDQRLGRAVAELERIGKQLSTVVDESRQLPERPRPIRLQPLIEQVARLVRYQLGKEIMLTTDVPAELQCTLPASGLRNALLNLVLNAAQPLHGRSGAVRLTAERQENAVEVRVCDNGPGFPMELLDAEAHEFATSRGVGALGLATVKRFALANAGRLELSNLAEGGGCAILRLHDQAAR